MTYETASGSEQARSAGHHALASGLLIAIMPRVFGAQHLEDENPDMMFLGTTEDRAVPGGHGDSPVVFFRLTNDPENYAPGDGSKTLEVHVPLDMTGDIPSAFDWLQGTSVPKLGETEPFPRSSWVIISEDEGIRKRAYYIDLQRIVQYTPIENQQGLYGPRAELMFLRSVAAKMHDYYHYPVMTKTAGH
jgi:hypothetical protein